jgi:preprotein translocase subunit SecF
MANNINLNGILKTVTLVVGFIVLVVGGGIAYGELKTKVDTNSTAIVEVKETQKDKADEKDVEEIKQDIKDIQKDIKKILEKLD